MTARARATAAAVAPYAAWMALMSLLPATAAGYAVRAAVTFAVLVVCTAAAGGGPFRPLRAEGVSWLSSLSAGAAVGVAVCALWILPEIIPAYRDFSLLGALGLAGPAAADAASPYDPAVCGRALTWAKLAGSAFVIAPVEEIFFRSFLYRWLQKGDWTKVPLSRFDLHAFAWTVAVFALEHHTRIAAGAMAGVAYGALAVRRGVLAAIAAHVVTNLLLGLYVVGTGAWRFW